MPNFKHCKIFCQVLKTRYISVTPVGLSLALDLHGYHWYRYACVNH